MKISGIILNGKNKAAVQLAKIRLKVQDKEIATIFTDEHGRYEHTTDEDYTGSILTYTIEKDGFEEKTYRSVIDKPDIQKKFLLREHEKIADTRTSLKFMILGIGIVVAVVLLLYLMRPQIIIVEERAEDSALRFNNLDLNDKDNTTFTIMTKGWGNVTWEIIPDEWWIKVEPRNNTPKSEKFFAALQGKEDIINVTVFTPDTELSPVNNVSTYLRINGESDWSKIMPGEWFNRKLGDLFTPAKKKELIITVSANNTYKPELKVTVPENKWNLTRPFTFEIKNTGKGSLFWTIRDDVTWIQLEEVGGKKYSENKDEFRFVGFDNGTVTFSINCDSSSPKEGDTGNIFIESNNYGKFRIELTVKSNNTMQLNLYKSSPVEWKPL